MKTMFVAALIGLFVLTACSPAGDDSAAPPNATPLPRSTEVKSLPTPSSPGDSVIWDALQVTMDRLEITDEYVTDFGSTRIPSNGNKFLWVHVLLKNTGQVEMDIPLLENFSILHAAAELKPTYGHRADYTDYTSLEPVIFPGQELDGWLRFDISVAAELKDLRFVFIPESAQVGASYNSPNYPYADGRPTYVWNCEP